MQDDNRSGYYPSHLRLYEGIISRLYRGVHNPFHRPRSSLSTPRNRSGRVSTVCRCDTSNIASLSRSPIDWYTVCRCTPREWYDIPRILGNNRRNTPRSGPLQLSISSLLLVLSAVPPAGGSNSSGSSCECR